MSNEDREPFLVSIIPFAGLALLLLVALVWRYYPENEAPKAPPPNPGRAEQALELWRRAMSIDIPLAPERDFVRGRADAPVTLVEFSDFECPFCKTATSAVDDVVDTFGEEVRVVFKNLPLDIACNETMSQPLHANACRAAYLARCAEEQGEGLFWKAHHAMFGASDLTDRMLEEIPGELGLDRDKLASCMSATRTVDAVKADLAVARELGIRSTPTFFINGKKVSDYRDGSLMKIVEAALGSAP